MTSTPDNLAQSLATLPAKNKTPNSARTLETWITQAQKSLDTAGGRLGWLVASTVVSAVLQRAVDDTGAPLFLLKGGTMLQYRLPGMTRTTQDVDGLVRGSMHEFLAALDVVLREPWGPLQFRRTEVETIQAPRLVKPRRFFILVQLNGATWRRIQVEVAADEGHAGGERDNFESPILSGFGLPSPDALVSLSMRYQIAQKVHACTDPHDPPTFVNDRARDLVDLLLLRRLIESTGTPALHEIREAVEDIFTARAREAETLTTPVRTWPAHPTAYEHWPVSYRNAADSAGVELSLDEAVTALTDWFDNIASSEVPVEDGDITPD